jgi:hypothetical protein
MQGWSWDKQTSLQTKDGQVKERTESQTEVKKRQDKRVRLKYAADRQNGKQKLQVFYNFMGLDQGTSELA